MTTAFFLAKKNSGVKESYVIHELYLNHRTPFQISKINAKETFFNIFLYNVKLVCILYSIISIIKFREEYERKI